MEKKKIFSTRTSLKASDSVTNVPFAYKIYSLESRRVKEKVPSLSVSLRDEVKKCIYIVM